MNIFGSTFSNAKVLITGHTGFKGVWLARWLKLLGADVTGLSLSVPTTPAHFNYIDKSTFSGDARVDICDLKKVNGVIRELKPDFVFHLAAQAIVTRSFVCPVETMSANAIGTANVLEALRKLGKPVVAVMITSDKAYDNLEWHWGYRETDRLGGDDPYSASKGMAELAIKGYLNSYFNSADSNVQLAIARAGNVIGGGDFALDRLVPDCMRAWSKEGVVKIRNPKSTRPWQHVLEPISGYLVLAKELAHSGSAHGEAFNFGPSPSQNQTVIDVILEMQNYWGNVRWQDKSHPDEDIHEAGLLKLNCDKAQSVLGWKPTLEFKETIEFTVDWYKEFYLEKPIEMMSFTDQQISNYVELARLRESIIGKE